MQIRISRDDGSPIYQQLVSQIKLLVATGNLNVGDKLLSVRKLAVQLTVNPNTVARAYRDLEQVGVVESRQGAGVFVTGTASPLSRKERNRRLNEKIDALLADARQLEFTPEMVLELVRQRSQRFSQEANK